MASRRKFYGGSDLKLSVIGDEDTVTGFLLAGIGHRDRKGQENFLTVNNRTSVAEIEDAFNDFSTRSDMAVILINQSVAERIRPLLDTYKETIPTVLEIPSKDHPYDASKDSVMQRVKVFFGGTMPTI
eukprot:Protomagalhaensia_sp_Gyna_25__2600@NODE_247_length_4197_cov_138_269360_g190_i0_p5_GENE_NODE_247_length_4197_cov_138_269360_g190_i0NODE_247_length_4197_cov_138_269360_g190_i0_p5_ORF_typecomplete_len128_score21_95ATPsynt_F/PF01990_17/1_6e36DUF257/PF03192_13/0_056_NODE_247_length_4197_cov_138_269360_g190_i017412124